MINQSFSQLSREEKQAKLLATLRCLTDNTLTASELKAITNAVRLERQYFIRVHHTFEAFFSDIMRPAKRRTQFIIGCRSISQRDLETMQSCAAKTGDPITAVVDHTDGKNGIYILIPKQRNKEGTIS